MNNDFEAPPSLKPPTARISWTFIAPLFAWFVIVAHLMPVTQDEAYYAQWAQRLQWGYFDHPPGVALLAFLSSFGGAPLMSGRLAAALVTCIAVFLCGQLYQLAGLRGRHWTHAMILLTTSLALLSAGILTTPDAALILPWTAALHEAAFALRQDPRRWLSAGFFTGLGLLSKYTVLLIGPVFLFVLLVDGKALKTRWPYLGGLVCLLTFAPHLTWNSEHHWITFKFQTRHGFSLQHDDYLTSRTLPMAQTPAAGDPEALLAKPFLAVEKPASPASTADPSWFRKLIKRQEGLIGGALGFLGCHLFVLLFAWFRRFRHGRHEPAMIDGRLKPLLAAAAIWPIAFFALVAVVSKVEANWAAMFVIGACPLLAVLPLTTRALVTAGLINASLVLAVAVHSRHPILPIQPNRDRILKETHGYDQLAAWIGTESGPVFADTYQIVSMLRWYGVPDVGQWPGITRPSHYVHAQTEIDRSISKIELAPGFTLVTTDIIPPAIAGFSATRMLKWLDCRQQTIITRAEELDQAPVCDQIHKWFIVTYQRADHAKATSD